jgi:hypothetical protein
MNEPNELNPPHECTPIARATPMGTGRDWWIGKLKEPMECHGAIEKFCLHLTTPLKSVTFLLNEADLSHLTTLLACAHGGPINEQWLLRRMQEAIKVKGEAGA